MGRWLVVVAACIAMFDAPINSQTGCRRPVNISIADWNAMSADAQDAACGGGPSAPKRSLEAHIQQLTGPDAVDCGTHQRATPIPEAMHQSLACARDAANQHKPFRIIQRGPSEDSEIAFGLIAEWNGSTRWFEYDSGPCGGPGCREFFDTRACLLPNVVVIHNADGRHEFRCIP